MIFEEFRKIFFEMGCVASGQVYAWRPGMDKNTLGRWVKKGWLIRLRNNFYCFPEHLGEAGFEWYAANRIYKPSYISLHSALAFYGMIPEAVVQVTSATSLKTAGFTNPFGSFQYHSISRDLMFGYDLLTTRAGRSFMMAQPEKAMLDLLYLYPFYNTPAEMESLRLDQDYMEERLDLERLNQYLDKFGNKALEARVRNLQQLIAS
jgi:predicted transcriptional regulator of viral defense system